jgi:hypothetical protein
MAKFCMSCGTPLDDAARFCTKCGATLGEASPPPSQASLTPVAGTAPSPTAPAIAAPATPPSSGSPVLKIILIVLGVFVLLGMVGVGSCFYVAYRAKRSLQRQVQMASDGGSITVQTEHGPVTITQSHSGSASSNIPVYPGATLVQGSSGTLRIGGASVAGEEYVTDDSADQVASFYREKLGAPTSSTQSGEETELVWLGVSGMTAVTIKPTGGKTHIQVGHLGR